MIPLITAIAITVGLALDSLIPGWGHQAANTFVALCFVVVFRLATSEERRSLITCVLFATAGELFLCFVWGLYEYRYGNIPVFVPLGHSIIFISGCRLARMAPAWTWKAVLFTATPVVLIMAITGTDTAGLVWYPMFLGCLLLKEMRHLYAVMFVIAFMVEMAGTSVGSWWWFHDVPWLGLSQTNPPVCAGVFYCVLDVLVVTQERVWRMWREARTAAA